MHPAESNNIWVGFASVALYVVLGDIEGSEKRKGHHEPLFAGIPTLMIVEHLNFSGGVRFDSFDVLVHLDSPVCGCGFRLDTGIIADGNQLSTGKTIFLFLGFSACNLIRRGYITGVKRVANRRTVSETLKTRPV